MGILSRLFKPKTREISASISFMGDFHEHLMTTDEEKHRVLEKVVSEFQSRYSSLIQKTVATYDQCSSQVGITFIMKPMNPSAVQEADRFFSDVIRPYRKRTL